MKKIFKFTPILLLAFLFPIAVFAQAVINTTPFDTSSPIDTNLNLNSNFNNTPSTFNFNTLSTTSTRPSDACASLVGVRNIICKVHQILNSIIPVLIALGVVYFVWGVVQYMIGGEEEAKKKGRNTIIYGIIGLAIIIGFYGLVNIVVNTFGLAGQSGSISISSLTSSLNGAEGGCPLAHNPRIADILGYASCIINKSVIPLIFTLATAMFVWGVVQFVLNSSEEAKKEKGRQFMIWGIIALAVMVSVWGLVRILGNSFGIEYVIPQVKR